MNPQAPFTLAPMMQPAPDSSFLGAMMKMRQMFPKQGALPGVAPPAQNSPVNPGAPPPAGDPAYVQGGEGPMAGGPAMPQPGLMQRMWGSLAPGKPAPFGIDPNSGLPITQDVAQGAAAMGPLPSMMMPQGGMNGW